KRDARVKSATYFVTMVDFTEAGELSVFIDEEQLRSLEERMNKKGYLEARDMHATFNMLRANDLIWSFVVNNYLLGKQPFPFDLTCVVNPTGSKYSQFENDMNPPTPEEWLAGATEHPDSWWPVWERWVAQYAGGEVPARQPGDGKLPPIEDAPGSYVKLRAE